VRNQRLRTEFSGAPAAGQSPATSALKASLCRQLLWGRLRRRSQPAARWHRLAAAPQPRRC